MFKILTDGCKPTRGSKYSACVDLYASEDVIIEAGETRLIGLGIAIDEKGLIERINQNECAGDASCVEWFFKSHYFQLMIRSSLAGKGLMLGNGVGIIDLDFADEIKMIIHNPLTPFVSFDNDGIERGYINQKAYYNIKKGDRIAQITLLEHKSYLFDIESESKRAGGFGSTGK